MNRTVSKKSTIMKTPPISTHYLLLQKKTCPLLMLLVFFPSISFSAGSWIDVRDGYETAYNRHELSFRGGYNFDNTAGIMFTSAYNLEAMNQFDYSWRELEGWYPLVNYNKFWVTGGALFNGNTDGSGGAGYFDFKSMLREDLTVTLRTRYNYRNYDSDNIYSRRKPANTLESHLGVSYNINNDWNYYFEPAYFKHLNNFRSANNKSYHIEVDNMLTYLGFKHIQPSIELAYLDRSAQRNRNNYRIRVGLRYNF